MNRVIPVLSWLASLYIAQVFLVSLTYKFTDAPETLHIFGTIGSWMSEAIAAPLGEAFTAYGAYATGVGELITSVLLLLPALLWLLNKAGLIASPGKRDSFHALGGLLSAMIMAGAVTFHLITPLGIEVLHQGQSDGGSLFRAGVIILVLGLLLFLTNGRKLKPEF